MSQMALINGANPPELPPNINFMCCGVMELLGLVTERPALVIADPPWSYKQKIGAGSAEDHYEGLDVGEIRTILDMAAWKNSRLALWHTWPILTGDWKLKLDAWGRPKTGGAWFKSDAEDAGHYGQGFHWAGCSEPVLIYTKGSPPCNRSKPLRNAWHEPPGAHSRKPVGWQRQWIRRWTDPGDLVLDLYAGLGSVAESCMLEGRRYIGAEEDPSRHGEGLSLLSQVRR